ncbi:hypothetical protein PV11_02891 [Exophiala sideris]|uniref:ER transporter 6TM N-terminal domain-containing protein n=1 Tax=Exophiala sideris TaxID=1016849 RepID=A0A0D1ZKK2_9EURO|nr:hypothetical protein PV11_02891 [Exophiala sideris]
MSSSEREQTVVDEKTTMDDRTHEQHGKAPEPKPGFFKRTLDLDLPTFLMMLKGGISPVIALAAYQSDAWAGEYTTLGYLVAIMAVISLPILPRAKFVQSMLISTFAVCTAAAMVLLAIRCTTSARGSAKQASATGTSGSQESLSYSPAANVTAAVFLFFNLWLANTLRALRPQLTIVAIVYCIFVTVSLTYAATFPNMAAGMSFVNRLLKTFLTGFGISCAVSFIIIPVSSRKICGKQMAGVLNLMKASISLHNAYLHTLTVAGAEHPTGSVDDQNTNLTADLAASNKDAREIAAKLKTTLQQAAKLFGQLKVEIGFAKKEIAIGKLRPEEFSKIWTMLRQILLPLGGLSTFADILQSVREHKNQGEDLIPDSETLGAIRRFESDEWHEIVALSKGPFQRVKEKLSDGITHVIYTLEFLPRPKSSKRDIEKNADMPPAPGDRNFAEHLENEIKSFEIHRRETVRKWCEKKGIEVPKKFWEDSSAQYKFDSPDSIADAVRSKQNHQQLYLTLYLEYLVLSVCQSVLDLVHYADSKVQDGTMSKKHFIFPGWKRIRKLFQHAFTQEDSEPTFADTEATGIHIALGDALTAKKDPEHLPPTNLYERMTNHLRVIPKFLGSDACSYGFRAAVASLSLALLGYLRQTHEFYLAQRGIWAVIMVAISMGPTAGAGVQGFVLRIIGTTVAMIASITIWYIADQKPAAIIPLTYICFVCGFYIILKKPAFIIMAIISMVTVILIIGYELQDLKIGTKLLTSNGQRFYHIYVLAPYRLATVVIGLTVAFIWTYFPFPITTHATLRKDLGATLYILANFYSITHSTVEMKLRLGYREQDAGKLSAMKKLDKARRRNFEKMIIMMNKLREHSSFTVYEPAFGGKFPKQTYDVLIAHMQSLFNYMSLINFAAQTFESKQEGEESEWLRDFRRLTVQTTVTSHELTSTLCLLSASMHNAQPLPPYVRVPPPIHLADQLASIDPGILSVQHIEEPCYAAFAVLEIASVLIMQETSNILAKVKELVGEVDFSLHVIGSPLDSTTSSLNNMNGKGKAD